VSRAIVVTAALLCLPMLARAQDRPKAELFGGYSFFHDSRAQDPRFPVDRDLNGFATSGAYYVTSWFAAEAGYSLYSGSHTVTELVVQDSGPPGAPSTPVTLRVDRKESAWMLLAGPRLTYPGSRLRPFGHVLFGAIHGRTENAATTSRPVNDIGNFPSIDVEDTGFGFAVGGGLDIVLSKSIAIRPLDVDYVHGDLNFGQPPRNGVRASAGFVFRFGR